MIEVIFVSSILLVVLAGVASFKKRDEIAHGLLLVGAALFGLVLAIGMTSTPDSILNTMLQGCPK